MSANKIELVSNTAPIPKTVGKNVSKDVLAAFRSSLPMPPSKAPSGYYVYQIRTGPKSDRRVVYVGKGISTRAWDHFDNLTSVLKRPIKGASLRSYSPMYLGMLAYAMKGHKFTVEIVRQDMEEDDAFRLEEQLIQALGRVITHDGPLLNLADGGRGVGSKYYEARSDHFYGMQVSKPTGVKNRRRPDQFARRYLKICFGEYAMKVTDGN